MKENEQGSAFLIAKPYSGQYLELLLGVISKNGLHPHSIYATDRWGEIARKIYQKNIDRMGSEFKVGLEGHIRLVNFLFGNRAIILLLKGSDSNALDEEETLMLAQKVKNELRSQAPGGEKLEDIIVFMNLAQIDIGCEIGGVVATGILGLRDDEGNFKAISKISGAWDYYYFKYVHAPDNLQELYEELEILQKMGALNPDTEISFQEFLIMAKLQTLVPAKMLK